MRAQVWSSFVNVKRTDVGASSQASKLSVGLVMVAQSYDIRRDMVRGPPLYSKLEVVERETPPHRCARPKRLTRLPQF